ncbi:MAG: hypothetical protein K0R70_790 [Steroidobacteraceae bacterium]|nr:hypothetical protein [Steroidobacteraceae bacterium]
MAEPVTVQLERAHPRHGQCVRARLGARTEDGEHACVGSSERVRGHGAGAPGSYFRNRTGIGDASHRALGGIEQHDHTAMRRATRSSRVRKHADQLGAEPQGGVADARHQREHPAVAHGHDVAQGLFETFAGQACHRIAHGVDARAVVEQAGDVDGGVGRVVRTLHA